MQEHDLSEIDLRNEARRIKLRRGAEPVVTMPAVAPAPIQQPAAPATGSGDAAGPAEDDNAAYIKSPMVGTFYTSPKPDTPAFVKVGDHVGPDSTVCIVEAMKVFNEIPAGISGTVVAVLVENGDPVEYGQPLFRVDASA